MVCALSSCDADEPRIGTGCTGTSTAGEVTGTCKTRLINLHLVTDNRSVSDVLSELDRVKQKLKTTEETVAYLSEKMRTYRYRWLEEYYRADNLERHMPSDIYVPHLAQIAEGAPSPGFSPGFLEWELEGEGEA